MLLVLSCLVCVCVFVGSASGQCIGDFDQNGVVDIVDLAFILDRYGPCPAGVCNGDVTGGKIVFCVFLLFVLFCLFLCLA
jgi:hypothetical protein